MVALLFNLQSQLLSTRKRQQEGVRGICFYGLLIIFSKNLLLVNIIKKIFEQDRENCILYCKYTH